MPEEDAEELDVAAGNLGVGALAVGFPLISFSRGIEPEAVESHVDLGCLVEVRCERSGSCLALMVLSIDRRPKLDELSPELGVRYCPPLA